MLACRCALRSQRRAARRLLRTSRAVCAATGMLLPWSCRSTGEHDVNAGIFAMGIEIKGCVEEQALWLLPICSCVAHTTLPALCCSECASTGAPPITATVDGMPLATYFAPSPGGNSSTLGLALSERSMWDGLLLHIAACNVHCIYLPPCHSCCTCQLVATIPLVHHRRCRPGRRSSEPSRRGHGELVVDCRVGWWSGWQDLARLAMHAMPDKANSPMRPHFAVIAPQVCLTLSSNAPANCDNFRRMCSLGKGQTEVSLRLSVSVALARCCCFGDMQICWNCLHGHANPSSLCMLLSMQMCKVALSE